MKCTVLVVMTIPQWADLPIMQASYNEDADTLIRQSIIGSMQLCEQRVRYQGEPGYLQMVSEPLAFGTAVHHLIAEDLKVGEPRLDMLATMNEWVEEILNVEYDWTLEKVPNPRDFFTEITSAYRQWRSEVYPKLPEPVALEEEIFLQLGESEGGNYFIKGTPDAVFENGLMDWKTAGRAWKDGKADYSIQASLYLALAKQQYGLDIKKFTFWVYNRQKREWDSIPTERRVREINAALLTAHDYARKLEAGTFTATPVVDQFGKKTRGWYCSARFCEAWNVCAYKYVHDDVDVNEVAVRSW